MIKLYQNSFCINFYANLLDNHTIKTAFKVAKKEALEEISLPLHLNQKKIWNSMLMLNGEEPILLELGGTIDFRFEVGKVV